MRIAFIHPRFPSAEGTGATHSATQIVTGLADAGHDVCVYCAREPEKNMVTNGMEVRHLSGNSNHPHTDTGLNKEVIAHLDELQKYDIVHSYLTPLIPSIARVGKSSGVGTVVTLNAYGGVCAKNDLLYRDHKQCRSKSIRKCLSCITRSGYNSDHGYLYQTTSQLFSLRLIKNGEERLKYLDVFQALSPHIKKIYSDFGYQGQKIEVIPNILDVRFDVENKTNFTEPFKLLYVGALKESKGVDRLVEVFSQVAEQRNVTLTIVGDGPLKKTVSRQIKEKGFRNEIEVMGQVPYGDLPAIYAAHDVFLYPGRWDEPFGRVFLEAMGTGTSIVSTDIGSVEEIIESAGIVTEESIDDLVDGVLSVLDSDTLQTLSKAGKQRIDMYRQSEIIPQFEKLYQTAIHRGG